MNKPEKLDVKQPWRTIKRMKGLKGILCHGASLPRIVLLAAESRGHPWSICNVLILKEVDVANTSL